MSGVTSKRRCYGFRPNEIDANLAFSFHPWKGERSPASQAAQCRRTQVPVSLLDFAYEPCLHVEHKASHRDFFRNPRM
jgi:hypothetical protein